MKQHLEDMINLYQSLWAASKNDEQEALKNQGTKFNREKLLRARTKKECYTDFINHLVGLRNIIARAEEDKH